MNPTALKKLELWIDNGFKEPIQKPQKHSKKAVRYLLVLFTICLCVFATAELLEYYAQISVDIEVLPSILVDNLEFPTIIDGFSAMQGETIRVNHTVENLNENNSLELYFNITQVSEGLIVSIDPLNYTLAPSEFYEFTIEYYILPNAYGNLTALIQVEYYG